MRLNINGEERDGAWSDLAALWRDLGLRQRGEALEFDDTARLAAIRKAITAAPASRSTMARSMRKRTTASCATRCRPGR